MARILRALIASVTLLTGAVQAQEALVLASTTSTEQSGLFGYLLPKFKEATGIQVRVVAVGTGQALEIGRRGDADALVRFGGRRREWYEKLATGKGKTAETVRRVVFDKDGGDEYARVRAARGG